MSTFYLIRHGATAAMRDKLCGRLEGIPLTEEGRRQAEHLATCLAGARWSAIYSSPLERARETAQVLARGRQVTVTTSARLTELDYGEWTGRTYNELASDQGWRRFNEQRALRRPPGGELLVDVRARVSAELELLSRVHPEAEIAIVTHADVIRAALTLYLGMPAEFLLRLEVAPASCSVLQLEDWGVVVKAVNCPPGFNSNAEAGLPVTSISSPPDRPSPGERAPASGSSPPCPSTGNTGTH